jgi:hypothetical protein
VTDAALAHLEVEDPLVEFLDRVRELLQVEVVTLLLLGFSSQQLVVTAATGLDAAVRQGIRIPMGKGFAGRVAAERQPVFTSGPIKPGVGGHPPLRAEGMGRCSCRTAAAICVSIIALPARTW